MSEKLSNIKVSDAVVSAGIAGLRDGTHVVRSDQAGNLYLFCPVSKRRHYLNEMAQGGVVSNLEKA